MAKKKAYTEPLPDIDLVQSIKVDIGLVDNNTGQIPGVPENPRDMTEMEYRKLLRSLKRDSRYTALNEIKIFKYKNRWIAIGGNMRLRAMKELGWETIIGKPIPEDTDAETLTRWILLDNVNFGKWDFDVLVNNFNEEFLSDMNIDIPKMSDPESEEEAKDDNPDIESLIQDVPRSRIGDIYQLGDHRLIVGDVAKAYYLDALMDGESADCIIINYEKRNGKNIVKDNIDESKFQEFLHNVFSVSDACLKPGGVFYIWHEEIDGYNFRKASKKVGWIIQQCIIWNRNRIVLSGQDYQVKHEPCLYGWKDGGPHYFINRRDLTTVIETNLDIESMTKDEMKKLLCQIFGESFPSSVIDEGNTFQNAENKMKPVPIIGKQIKNSSRRGEVILDVFGCCGTTLIASEQLGRKCRTVEYDPVYADVILKRWEELTNQKARYIGNIDDQREKENSTKNRN